MEWRNDMTNYYAAGSLLVSAENKDSIVLFKKKGSIWYSLPFGKKEEYETYSANTAIRETFEETGLIIDISTSTPVFVADKGGGKICHVWKATVNNKLTEALCSLCDQSEGTWAWGPPHLLVLGGSFKEYNFNMLKHFGYDIPTPSWKE